MQKVPLGISQMVGKVEGKVQYFARACVVVRVMRKNMRTDQGTQGRIMKIRHIEIANFRKLQAVRVDLTDDTTLLVGANNSGKSSAMLALRRFLVSHKSPFRLLDFTLCHLPTIDAIGKEWEAAIAGSQPPVVDSWMAMVPMLDLWLSAENGELHFVKDLIPSFSWRSGLVGVRFRLEPKDIVALYNDFRSERERVHALEAEAAKDVDKAALTLWPKNLTDFLTRRLGVHFEMRWYRLDPARLVEPDTVTREALPQHLGPSTIPMQTNPLAGLIRVHEINAQRGFGEMDESEDSASAGRSGRRLSEQLRAYYKRHLDPEQSPGPSDIDALRAMDAARDAFDVRLAASFRPAFQEVESLGYPGANDPTIHVTTQLSAADGINHESAVLFELDSIGGAAVTPPLRLPETSNGLGYQNLISMIFRLMSFRDAWLRKSKAALASGDLIVEPIHLVMIEEPEAHLHAQVQQVFVRHAYHVLTNDSLLRKFPGLSTQMVVSSHSSHIAHELPYASLRYFRRLPAGMHGKQVPISTVSNLESVFGDDTSTKRFVTRYLRSQHADVFFADALILVEGAAERILLPHFIRNRFPQLHQAYVTLLEVGGSHAHRLRPLLNALGIPCIVITDIDALGDKASVPVKRNAGQVTGNPTLRSWLKSNNNKREIDCLLDLAATDKVIVSDDLYSIRMAYQTPAYIGVPVGALPEEVLPGTFEDALVFANFAHFAAARGNGMIGAVAREIAKATSGEALASRLFKVIGDGDKAGFALGVLYDTDFKDLIPPRYIEEGLSWLQERIVKKKHEMLLVSVSVEEGVHE
ncbi:putative ATP-dependent endonuclease of OLD family [Xanthomonas arboricola]|uniref:AAA family ATPase n=2 Tax=Xanthomonas TaxID=338 RepID=UPI00179C6921|nr:AAA family ATPase [Xanthomonas arboricola]MBB5734409.1 putative ATP-dependent endonuclease of OLD family [Xanthomonas sp. CFBP 8152]